MKLNELNPSQRVLVEECRKNVKEHLLSSEAEIQARIFDYLIEVAIAGEKVKQQHILETVYGEVYEDKDVEGFSKGLKKVGGRVSSLHTSMELYNGKTQDPIHFIPPKRGHHYTWQWNPKSNQEVQLGELVNREIRENESLAAAIDKISVTQISDNLMTSTDSSTLHAAWSQAKIYDALQSAPKGSEVRILDTLLKDIRVMCTEIRNLLERGVNVKIVLMNHENECLVKARFSRREDGMKPRKAIKTIKEQLEALRAIPNEADYPGTLEVQQSDLMPFCFFVQSGESILMGLMPPLHAYEVGPMLEVKVHSKLGQKLLKEWEAYWKPKAKKKAPAKSIRSKEKTRTTPRRK